MIGPYYRKGYQVGILGDIRSAYQDTYMHLGRKAESMMAPVTPRPFPLKSASTMEVSMVTGLLFLESPLNVNCDMAPIFYGYQ
jgi:hypothetical protein